MPPPYIGPIIDVVKKPFSHLPDVFAVKPKPIVLQAAIPAIEGQGLPVPPSSSTLLAEVSLVPGDYVVFARFNLEIKAFAPGRTVAHARTQLKVGIQENVWNNIDFVLNYGPRSLVAAHMLGVKGTGHTSASVRVLGDPEGSELIANFIVLACIPAEDLEIITTPPY